MYVEVAEHSKDEIPLLADSIYAELFKVQRSFLVGDLQGLPPVGRAL